MLNWKLNLQQIIKIRGKMKCSSKILKSIFSFSEKLFRQENNQDIDFFETIKKVKRKFES